MSYPRCSMYGLFTYIYHNLRPNVVNTPYIEHLGIENGPLFSGSSPFIFSGPELRKKNRCPIDWSQSDLDPLMDPDTMSTWRHVTSYPSPDEVIEEYLGQEEFQCVVVFFNSSWWVSIFMPKRKEWKMKMEASWQKYLLNHVTYRDLRCTLELVPSVLCLKFFLKPRNLSHEMAVNMGTTMGIHYLHL